MSDTTKNPALVITTATALQLLWRKSADDLTRDELASFAGAGDQIGFEIANLADSIESVGCLVAGDQNPAGYRTGALQDSSPYLFTPARHLEALSALVTITGDANHRLEKKGGAA